MDIEIKRDEYLNRLLVRRHNGFIKVITGIRRCGKSYLLNTIFYDRLINEGIPADHIIKFAFDSAEDLLKIGEDPIKLDDPKGKKKVDPALFLRWLLPLIADNGFYYILLDEVQKLGAFESVLNGFLRKDNLDVYVTGSNSRFLSSDIITEFAGRGDEVHVLPLSFSEYYGFRQGDKSDAFDDYSLWGGLPAVALMETDEQKSAYLITQMRTLYLRDIIERIGAKDDRSVSEVLDIAASGVSTLLNPKKIADTIKSVRGGNISETTVDRYIGQMEEAFILSKARRYNVKGRKYIGTPYKIYFEDIGLRNARLNFRQTEGNHIMENIIYNELRFRGYSVDVGTVEKRVKSRDGKEVRTQLEIDFVANMGSKRYYIQSAYAIPDEAKYEQETAPLDKVDDSFKKIIVVEKSMKPRRDDKGYITIGVKEFLLDRNSLDA